MPRKTGDIFKRAASLISETSRERDDNKKLMEEDRKALIGQLGEQVTRVLEPVLNSMIENASVSRKEMIETLSQMRIESPEVRMPDFPEIKIPTPQVTVQVPEMKIPPMPAINIPETIFPDRMKVELDGVDRMRPLPAMLVDIKGKPMQFGSSVSGGGKADFLTIKDIRGSTASLIDQVDGALKVVGDFSATATFDADFGFGEVASQTLRTVQASDAISSVNVMDAFGSTSVDGVFNADNRVRVSVETGGSGLTDSELRATSVPVAQASGAIWSMAVIDIFGSTAATSIINPDNRLKVELPSGTSGLTDSELRATSVPVSQVSGANWSTEVTNTVTVDGSGVTQPVSATNLDIRDLANASDSVSAYQVSGAVWSTEVTNTVTVTGSLTSTVVVGDIPADAADTGSAPVKVGGIARTANPTAVAAGDRVSATHDDLGRQVFRPLQVRDLIQTAYVSVTNGTETTLRAAVAGAFLDLIMIVGSNNSDAAVSVDVRPVTAGNIINTLRIPANGTAGWTPPTPWPQSEQGNNWTVDGPDETGRTLTFSALFSQEV